jgi:hypothetical protein
MAAGSGFRPPPGPPPPAAGTGTLWARDAACRLTVAVRVLQEAQGQAALVGELAQQDPAGMADQAVPVGSDLQGMVPPVKLHGEKRSSPVDCKVVVTRNLPGPGRFSLLKQARDGRFAAAPSQYRDPQIAPHP